MPKTKKEMEEVERNKREGEEATYQAVKEMHPTTLQLFVRGLTREAAMAQTNGRPFQGLAARMALHTMSRFLTRMSAELKAAVEKAEKPKKGGKDAAPGTPKP